MLALKNFRKAHNIEILCNFNMLLTNVMTKKFSQIFVLNFSMQYTNF